MVTAARSQGLDASTTDEPRPDDGRSTAPGKLAVAVGAFLLLVVLYAVFDRGAVSLAPATRVEIAVSLISVVALAGRLGPRPLRLDISRTALAGLACLAAFAVWSAVTLAWSVAPDRTWIELNRVIAYTLVVGVSIWLGAP